MTEEVFLLWYKGKYNPILFGVYKTKEDANAAANRYEPGVRKSNGRLAIEQVSIGVDLAKGYLLSDGK